MDQYLLIPFLMGWTSINPSYFGVHGTVPGFWPIAMTPGDSTHENGPFLMGQWPIRMDEFPVYFPYQKCHENMGYPLPIGSMYAIYGNMDPINIPPMLAYIPAPWIRHGIYFMIILYSLPESSILIDPISFGSRREVSTRHSTTRHGPWRPMFFFSESHGDWCFKKCLGYASFYQHL